MGKRIPSSIELEKDYWLWLPKFLAVLFVGGLVCLVILTDFGENSHHISPQHLPLNHHNRDLGALPDLQVASETRPSSSRFLENVTTRARLSETSEQLAEEASSGETAPSAEGGESLVDAAVRSQAAASSVQAASGQAEEASSEDALRPVDEAQPRHEEASFEDFKVKEVHRAQVEPPFDEGVGLNGEQLEIQQEARSDYSPSVEPTVAGEADVWYSKLAPPGTQEGSAPSDTASLFDALPPSNEHTNKAKPLSLLMNISFTRSPPPGELRSKQAMEYPACRGEALLGSENITTVELKNILVSKIMVRSAAIPFLGRVSVSCWKNRT
ncbi:hypothetical protein CYMTET_31090 [Cymbomonas tetramitiformis]|uniref:Uncharacterized protein n=1 Tax=Cymbomonas tetramitiformis TaxID=36881 RepID=A0AAE0FHT5_9CHLO|nr:hypothetical protein CYMTET_31090 [Cymbomonas tetramitiformis]